MLSIRGITLIVLDPHTAIDNKFISMEDANENTVAILCAERHPSRCLRLIISNWLAAHDLSVEHIIVNNKDEIEVVSHKSGQWGAMPIIKNDGEIVYPKNTTSNDSQ